MGVENDMKADKTNNYGYNKRLQPFANKLRKEMTKAEACLWKYALRARQMKGYQFRRQRPVLNYIADFMCKELKLVIEVDGITHHWAETIIRDNKKTEELQKAGFKVVRFTDDEVLNDMQGVIRGIEDIIEGMEDHPLKPPPAGDKKLSPSGGGGRRPGEG